jgi:Fic family protein
MRAYDETFTWLRFRAELRLAPPSFWILLGDVIALQRQLRTAPMPRTEARSLERSVVTEGLAARLALDGHALTTDQVRAHLEGRDPAVPDEPLLRDVDDLFLADQQLQAASLEALPAIDPEALLALHRSVTRTTSGPGGAGRWRTTEGHFRHGGVPPDLIASFMEELCDWLAGPELAGPAPDEALHHALLKGLLLELHIAWIAPFDQGNSRVAGLAMQHLLLAAGGDNLLSHLTARHFHRSRQEYIRQVDQAAQGQGDPIPFIAYALRGIRGGLEDLIARMRAAQTTGLWRDHVRSALDGVPGARSDRQAQLLMELGERRSPIAPSAILTLTPELARAYAGLSSKTLQRDLEDLAATGILIRSPQGVLVRKAPILAFKGREQ